MNSGSWSLEPISQDSVLVAVALGLVAVLAILTVIGMVIGARNKRRRVAAEKDEQERIEALKADGVEATNTAEGAPTPGVTPPAPPAPVAPAPPPLADQPAPSTPPEPAPLADEPIAAAAPLDASPASVAADVPEPAAASDADAPLTMLKGLGPKIATRLGELGIASVGQLAWLDDQEAADLDAQLGPFQGRMARDRWREQARLLANGDRAGFEREFGKLGG